ncbi:MAG: fimbrillin family protein [Bacteroidaceae bacterium]
MKTRRYFPEKILLLLLAAGVTGCTKNETDDNQLLDSKQPMTFTAQMYSMEATRATYANTWTGGEEVAVQIGSEVKKYTVSDKNTGKLTAAAGVTPFYWTSATVAAEAWHSTTYAATKPTSFQVSADQSATGYQQSDMIYATATIRLSNPILSFKHLPAKVVVNLKAGEGITEANVQAATVTLINQYLTSGAISTKGSVAQVRLGRDTIKTNAVATPTSGFQKSVQALVVPQRTNLEGPFISITFDGQEFVYATSFNFVAGKQYTYNITVAKNRIIATVSEAEAWTGTTTDVRSKESVATYTASDLKIGDYYYSDGTWSDGGVRILYDDGTVWGVDVNPKQSGTNGQKRTVAGIVFFVRDSTAPEDAGGYTEFQGAPTGYIVGLKENTSKWWNYLFHDRTSSQTTINGYYESYCIEEHLRDNAIAIPWCKRNTKITNQNPVTFSNWYMISIKELKILANAISLINYNISQAEGTTLTNRIYFTANRMGRDGNYVYVFNPITKEFIKDDNRCAEETHPYRAACAFKIN